MNTETVINLYRAARERGHINDTTIDIAKRLAEKHLSTEDDMENLLSFAIERAFTRLGKEIALGNDGEAQHQTIARAVARLYWMQKLSDPNEL